MCFSAEASFIVGGTLVAIGITTQCGKPFIQRIFQLQRFHLSLHSSNSLKDFYGFL